MFQLHNLIKCSLFLFWIFSFQIADINQVLAVNVLTSDKREIELSPGWPWFFKHCVLIIWIITTLRYFLLWNVNFECIAKFWLVWTTWFNGYYHTMLMYSAKGFSNIIGIAMVFFLLRLFYYETIHDVIHFVLQMKLLQLLIRRRQKFYRGMLCYLLAVYSFLSNR